jgi:pimeloyl-ACP methyl ester carboxylesterase
MRTGHTLSRRAGARRLLALALATAVVASGAACTSSSHHTARRGAPSPSATASGTAGPVAQRPTVWTPCPQISVQQVGMANPNFDFDCATIQVPQDWHHPDNGKTFDLAIVRARSKQQTDRIGSLVVNPGGPGGSGVQLAAGLVAPGQNFPTAITDRFDIVGFDPRGVGESTEIKCLSGPDQDALFAADPDPVTQAGFDQVVALNRTAEAPCGAKYGSQLPLFSTDQAARDMDAVRIAVGDKTLNYLGYSYGTLLGAVYDQVYPTKVRAMVLDGAIDPQQDVIQRSESQAAGFEHAFGDFSTWCTANPTKCPISANPLAAVQDALATGRTHPVDGPDGRKATAGWIFTAVAEAMYSENEWETLAKGIAQLKTGSSALIFGLADNYAGRSPDGQYTNMFDDNDAVNCADFAHQPSLTEIRTLQSQWRQKYPLFGGPLAVGLVTCAAHVWPGGYDPYPTGAATGSAPVVVVGTTGDPATPYAQTAKLADMLGDGHVITWDGEGHTAYPQTTCITDAVNAYLINLTLPKPGLTCPATS